MSGLKILDGASQLTNLHTLNLGINQITSIETGDFNGLQKLEYLRLFNNNISNIERGAFAGLNLRDLNMNGNAYNDLHLEGVTFDRLQHLGIDRGDVKSLYLDNAILNIRSYNEIVRETTEIRFLSLVGLSFSEEKPYRLSELLDNERLTTVKVGATLFDSYAGEFRAFGEVIGNSLLVIREGDCNEDGARSVADFSCLQTIHERDALLEDLDSLPGDFDGNGTVDFPDFLVLVDHFGQTPATYADGNLDLENGVGFQDFVIFADSFGKSAVTSVQSVPEPSSWCLAFVGLLFRRWFETAKQGRGATAKDAK